METDLEPIIQELLNRGILQHMTFTRTGDKPRHYWWLQHTKSSRTFSTAEEAIDQWMKNHFSS